MENKLKIPNNLSTTLEEPIFNNVKRKRQPKKQWSPLADTGSKRKLKILKKPSVSMIKIKNDTLKKTCMRKRKSYTSESESDYEATPNEENKKMDFTDKNEDLFILRSIRCQGNESPTKEELKTMLQEVLKQNEVLLSRNAQSSPPPTIGKFVELKSTSDVVTSFSQQDATLEDPLITNGMLNIDKFQNNFDRSDPPQECHCYKHEDNNEEQNKDSNEKIYDKETSEDENEGSNDPDRQMSTYCLHNDEILKMKMLT